MKESVKPYHLKRFDELYHIAVKSNKEGQIAYPEILKNLNTLDISIIDCISNNTDMMVREIANLVGIPSSTLTSALNRLEKKSYINRVISKRDLRSFDIVLTEKGKSAQEAHINFERVYFEAILSKLDTDNEREIFLGFIEKILT